MFGWFKKREQPRLTIVGVNNADRERAHKMRVEQLTIQQELGFDPDDDAQSWLRLHQILKHHEERIKALEGKK